MARNVIYVYGIHVHSYKLSENLIKNAEDNIRNEIWDMSVSIFTLVVFYREFGCNEVWKN